VAATDEEAVAALQSAWERSAAEGQVCERGVGGGDVLKYPGCARASSFTGNFIH
jgi:hypothetical protein